MMVLTGVALAPKLASLLVGIGMVTGQLLGPLLLDVLPHPEDITPAEVFGTVVTLLAVFVASWQRGGRPHPRKA
jgi:transporter family-2 protein